MDNKYGYKICYKKNKKQKLHKYIITNAYGLALFNKHLVEKYKQEICKAKPKLKNTTWHVVPVANKQEYKKVWKRCPF